MRYVTSSLPSNHLPQSGKRLSIPTMRFLFFLLALTFASDPVVSDKVEVYNAGENDHVTLQSVRDKNKYLLRIEITSSTWQVGHGPCEATFDVDHKSLTVPCAMSSREVIRPRTPAHFVVEFVTISDTAKVRKLLNGKLATIKIGSYEIELTKSHLRQLRTVLK